MKQTAALAVLATLLASQVNAARSTHASSTISSTHTSSTTSSWSTPTPTSSTSTFSGVGQWHQCGGIGWTGPTVCQQGLTCVPIGPGNSYFLTCSLPTPSSTTSTFSATSSTTTSTTPSSSSSSTYPGLPQYKQCGGQGYTGPTVCAPGLSCISIDYPIINPYFSTCAILGSTSSIPSSTSSTSTTSSTPTSTSRPVAHTTTQYYTIPESQPEFAQCGGIGWIGLTTCQSPFTCQKRNEYYSQCLP